MLEVYLHANPDKNSASRIPGLFLAIFLSKKSFVIIVVVVDPDLDGDVFLLFLLFNIRRAQNIKQGKQGKQYLKETRSSRTS